MVYLFKKKFFIKIKKNKFYYKSKLLFIIIFLFGFIKYKDYIKNKIKICLCVIAKEENLYVREFVENYKNLGYNNIFIYDNNNKNGENFSDVISDYIQNGFVKIIDYRDRSPDTKPQVDAYRDCYSRNSKLYDWLSFFDMDEFLELNKKYKKIQDFLNSRIFEKCQNIKINWAFVQPNKILYYENKSLSQRFKNFIPNQHIKSTVRGNLPINYWIKLYDPHTSALNVTTCSSSGKLILYMSPVNIPPELTNARLKHYYYKSFEEFCIKQKKGKADRLNNSNKKYIESSFKNLYLNNRNDPEKLKIVLRVFNYTNNDLNISFISLN